MEALQYQFKKSQLPRKTEIKLFFFQKKYIHTYTDFLFSLMPTVDLQKSQYVDYFQQEHTNHIINMFTYFQLLNVISLPYFAVLLH